MRYFLLILSIFFASGLCAQWNTVKPRLDIGLYGGVPIEEYAEATDGIGFGANLHLSVPISRGVPIYGGFNFGYMLFGSQTQRETLSADVTSGGDVVGQIDVPLRIVTNNNIYFWHLTGRLQLPIPVIQPYIQGMAGFRYMNTNTKIYDDSPDGDWSTESNGLITRQTQLSDYVWSSGVGAGLHIQITRSFMIDAQVDYMYGGRARYYDGEDTENWEVSFAGTSEEWDQLMNDDNVNGDVISFESDPRESVTNMVNFTLGVSILLGDPDQPNQVNRRDRNFRNVAPNN